MSKLLSQGGYGCVFYPGIECNGETSNDRTIVTKVQEKNFTADNEIKIGKIIHKQGGYDLFFLPVISDCDINVRKASRKELKKCKIIKDYKNKYVAMNIPYIENKQITDIIKNNTASNIILVFIESYRYLLMSLEKLNAISVVHFDIKLENIVFKGDTYEPRIIDFGISIPINELNKHNMRKYFYVYAPSYYVWCIDINIISFLLHETNDDLTEEDANTLSKIYVLSNNVIGSYSSEFIDQYLDLCIKQTKKYVGRPRDELIQELLSYSKTWDNYSLSIAYIKLIDVLFPNRENSNKFIINMNKLLMKNIHPDPTERMSIQETMTEFSNLFYIEEDVSSFLKLSKYLENIKSSVANTIKIEQHHLKNIFKFTKQMSS